MKKIILYAVATIFFVVVTNAQTVKDTIKKNQESILKKEIRVAKKELKKIQRTEVSNETKKQFITDFGNVTNVKWEISEYYSEATFLKDGKLLTAFYDNEEGLVGTSAEKTIADLPTSAKKFLNEKYGDYKVVDIIFFDDNDLNETAMVIFNKQIDDEDSYFVELKKDNKKIVLQVDKKGQVYFFTRLS